MKQSTVDHILEVGKQLIHQKGYHAVGLQEILSEADIPKGSFYYYFKSKEDFGIKVIRHYSKQSLELLENYLNDTSKSPRERLLSFYKDRCSAYEAQNFTEGCLLGNCSLELSDLKATFAQSISSEFDKWDKVIEQCIEAGQQDGSISNAKDPKILAAFILNSFEGALLRMKAAKKGTPLHAFLEFLDELI